MVHAAKHASAHRIIAVTPWYGYSRQDKKSAPREPISARLVAELLETAGIDRLVTMDLHAGQIQGFFSRPVDHMTAMPVLTQYVQDQLAGDDLVIIAPDAGRVKLVRKFAQKVGAPYALLEKERPAQQVAEIGYVIGDVKGKVAVIVDDIIATGRHARRLRPDRARRGRREGVRGRHARALLGQRVRGAHGVPAVGHRGHRHGPAARGRARTASACSPPRTSSPTRSGGSSPTTRCRRSSRARTSCSEPARRRSRATLAAHPPPPARCPRRRRPAAAATRPPARATVVGLAARVSSRSGGSARPK